MKRRSLLAAAALGSAALLASATTAGATANAAENRLAGPDRYDTARVVAERTFSRATVAVLASGQAFPDALASSYLAGRSGGPVLLTPQGDLPNGVIDTMRALNISGVEVIGGTAAIGDAVTDELRGAGLTSDRVAGSNRYETARLIAQLLPAAGIGTFNGGRGAIVVSGESFADALAAGPLAAKQGVPILLTTPGSLHAEARRALTELGIQQVLVVGGTDAVSTATEDAIKAMNITTTRRAGASRQQTAALVTDYARTEMAFGTDGVLLARGDNFADALAGGIRGGELQRPILLTDSVATLGDAARGFITANRATISAVEVLGGTAAVSQAAVNDAVAAARAT